ncbi:hypothetical protein DS742_26240 [Lacrimispora amygdalina]|uniref:Fibronectin type III domain-containing protein n=1 Tax=Lacrimispora amygdalina TaxID=253257 RepID=A0A3E2N4P0_9FIRM|nr:hypothetical protein [Clostridium indicum]RFZ75942.1 hypothetical protein DS742_26240 [Clostridium indicum]
MIATIHTIEPFDVTLGTDIKFTWSGNQIFKVRCIIKNNTTGVVVYDDTIDTMKQSFPLPPESGLANGIKYMAYITVFDINEEESSIQNTGTLFYCFTTPTFQLSVSDGDIIRASSYNVSLMYEQAENEKMDYYNISLYSYQKTLLQSSGEVYDVTNPSYIITNLANATQYYLRATGKTINGFLLDTGYILVTVQYIAAQVFSTLELNNIPENGSIEIKCHIISTLGVSENEVVYINDGYDTFADLRNNSVTFDDGFRVVGDFTIQESFHSPIRNRSVLSFTDGRNMKADVFYRIGSYSDSDGEKCYFELNVTEGGNVAVYNSKYLPLPINQQEFSIMITRENGLYDFVVKQINYNTWGDLEELTWEQVEQYNWNQIRTVIM